MHRGLGLSNSAAQHDLESAPSALQRTSPHWPPMPQATHSVRCLWLSVAARLRLSDVKDSGSAGEPKQFQGRTCQSPRRISTLRCKATGCVRAGALTSGSSAAAPGRPRRPSAEDMTSQKSPPLSTRLWSHRPRPWKRSVRRSSHPGPCRREHEPCHDLPKVLAARVKTPRGIGPRLAPKGPPSDPGRCSTAPHHTLPKSAFVRAVAANV